MLQLPWDGLAAFGSASHLTCAPHVLHRPASTHHLARPNPPTPPTLQLIHLLRRRQAAYRTTIEQDDVIIADLTTGPRQTVAARLLRIEKQILAGAIQAAMALPGAADAVALGPLPTAVKME